MIATSKQGYVDQWQKYIDGLSILAFCDDEKLNKEVKKHITELKELVVKIAETKNFKTGDEK